MSQCSRQLNSVDAIASAKSVTACLLRGALLIGGVLLLGGCVTTVGYESPYSEGSTGAGIYQPPPPLPADAEPPCPGDGYLWVPGYWSYSGGYHWVPGSWTQPPQTGLLWTPGYWGFASGVYVWHEGYWGPHVGFYGGVPYGFGYDGVGYQGGRWEGRHFVYNRYVTNVDERVVHYTYNERVNRTFDRDRVSYEGGRGGIIAHPTRENLRYAHEVHVGPTLSQRAHIEQSSGNRALFTRDNSAHAAEAATAHPGHFQDAGVERARGPEGFGPQGGRSNGHPGPNSPSRPFVQPRTSAPARPNVEAGRRYPAAAASYAQQPLARPQPRRGGTARVGPAPRPQERAAPGRKGRNPHPDR